MTNPAPLANFGRNISIQPTAYYEPRDEQELLQILERHRGQQIRAVGRLHSWSEAAGGNDIVINLRHLQQIQVITDDTGATATIEAGCQVKTVQAHLKSQGLTLPSVGLIDEQTVVGAMSTGTHGSGRNSLSHYVTAVRVARYDAATGAAIIEQIDHGDALRAARCALGCLGIIISITMQCRKRYFVEEHLREYPKLETVLAAEEQYPLQQFFFTPWRWTFLAQHRRESPGPRSKLAGVYRAYWHVTIDLCLHMLVLGTIRLLGSFKPARFVFRRIVPHSVVRGWKVTDDSAAMLVMEHEIFRHIEMELFVHREELPAALEHVKQVLIVASNATSAAVDLKLDEAEASQLQSLRGIYGHHYPICIRRVQVDDTLISMASGGTSDWYAISLISYAKPHQRQGFELTMTFLAETMSKRFGARPHWGKYCPLPEAELRSLYPQFAEFQSQCESRDPQGVFRNAWLARVLKG
jgi:FAD/FMN-containing dehydrogenase